jgi:ABC-type polysaccharide/polyol phosphate export permease
MRNSVKYAGLSDLVGALKRYALAGMLGWQDVRQRYRRSALGPFWLTVSMGVMIGTIGIVFGQIFKSPMKEFLPFLSAGLILWSFISSLILEGCTSFIAAEGIIKQLPIPLFVHIMRMIWRNFVILCHNLLIIPIVFLVLGKSANSLIFISIPGFLLLTINLAWLALILAILCARYRDLPQIIGSLLQVFFYVTPIMWMPNLLPNRSATYLLDTNPFYHLIEIVRLPLLGGMPSLLNWTVSLVSAVIGWSIALVVFNRYRSRIAYWL